MTGNKPLARRQITTAAFEPRHSTPEFYDAESQLAGVPTQAVTLLQPLAKPLPIFVFLIATQKTRATSTTIKVYSTKPWPSSSTNKRFKSSMYRSPPFLFWASFQFKCSVQHDAWATQQNICQTKVCQNFGYLPSRGLDFDLLGWQIWQQVWMCCHKLCIRKRHRRKFESANC